MSTRKTASWKMQYRDPHPPLRGGLSQGERPAARSASPIGRSLKRRSASRVRVPFPPPILKKSFPSPTSIKSSGPRTVTARATSSATMTRSRHTSFRIYSTGRSSSSGFPMGFMARPFIRKTHPITRRSGFARRRSIRKMSTGISATSSAPTVSSCSTSRTAAISSKIPGCPGSSTWTIPTIWCSI